MFDCLPPIVTVEQNFDELLIPLDHVSRRPSDTYYVDANRVLRCHTSAHQTALLNQGHDAFLVCGDVYRRDEVDSTHYPVFHQMEGVRVMKNVEVREGVVLCSGRLSWLLSESVCSFGSIHHWGQIRRCSVLQ